MSVGTPIRLDTAERLLADLVAIKSVNPMGREYHGTLPVERSVVEYLERLFAPYDVALERQACSRIHESLLVTVPGREEGPATLLESHMDTVPADEWLDRAFEPRRENGLLYGRGACDDKASLASMTLALLNLLSSGEKPRYPVLFLAAGDEEYTQTGIKHFTAAKPDVGRAVFGEPTRLAPVIRHKGTIRWDITVRGRSAHTSRPELGSNAIVGMMDVMAALRAHQEKLQREYFNPLISGPSLTVTMIQGGRTRNAVPDSCTIALDFRVPPGLDLANARKGVLAALESLGHDIVHEAPQLMTPALNTSADDPFSLQVREICRAVSGRSVEFESAPYGTDAAWAADLAPSIVLGPGDVASAHAIDERVEMDEVVACARIYREIVANPAAAPAR